jgi:multiple sugar transport system permease protein
MKRISALIDKYPYRTLVGPAVGVIAIMMVFPVIFTVALSFTHWTGSYTNPPEFAGLDNYIRLLTADERFWQATFRTLLMTVVGVGAQTIIGVALAVLLHRQFALRGLARSVMLLPMIATPVAVALIWRLMFHPQLGILNEILATLGIAPSDWIADPALALGLLIVVDTWEWAPLIALITLAGLNALPEEPFEAAHLDGANAWRRFWHITLPMVRPTIVVAVVFRMIEALKTFDIIFVMTQGGPGFATETLNIYAYNVAFQYQRLGYSGALLVVFFLLVLTLTTVTLSFRRAKD